MQWFTSWFDSIHYHRLYKERDASEAARFVDALIAHLRPPTHARVLDLGCGAGRHARRIAAGGLDVTGIDLSAVSIAAARRSEHPRLRFLRRDMRQPFGNHTYDYVLNMFTSFGYFDRRTEDLRVVRNIATALKPGGTLVLDYLNTPHAEKRLQPIERRTVDGTAYRITRWIDDRHFFKRIVVEDGSAPPLQFVERVEKLRVEDFVAMFAGYGLRVREVFGDYGLGRYDADSSPRLILVAAKDDQRDQPFYRRDRFLRMRLSVSGETPRYEASIH